MRLIMIRLLGSFEVTRPDGSIVGPREWSTGKTADLLRLLALDNGRPVRQESLIDTLWPDVPTPRARSSLRTAASRIRRVVRHNCVLSRPDGLVLQHAWVDLGQFHRTAGRVTATAPALSARRVVALTLAAERHYRGDLRAHDDQSAWAAAERERLTVRRHQMLCEASSAALALRQPREALEFARTAARLDRSSETAHRALMRCYGELGEVGQALRVFESYRAHLADEMGADPSPQTRDLHLELLRRGAAPA